MLVFTRKPRQSVLIGDDVTVTVQACGPKFTRLAISAPREIAIRRDDFMTEEHDPSLLHPLSDYQVSGAKVADVCDWLIDRIDSTSGPVRDAYTKTLRQLEQLLPRP